MLLADFRIHRIKIFAFITALLFSLLIKVKPMGFSLLYFFPLLYSIPIYSMLIVFEFRDSYLQSSNPLAKTLITILNYYFGLCLTALITLLFLYSYSSFLLRDYSLIVFFLPIYAILFMLNVVWLFLYYGFTKLEYKASYFLVLGNLVFYSTLSILVYIKLSFALKSISWIHLAVMLITIQLLNTLVNIQRIMSRVSKQKDFNSSSFNSISMILNIAINISYFAFVYALGMGLEGLLVENQVVNLIFLGFWVFCFLNLFKSFYKVGRITSYFEWKKNVII